MSRYAETTSVPIEKSKAEIERLLRRYGAEQFISGWDHEQAVIGCAIHGRQLKFRLPLPPREDFLRTPSRRQLRSAEQVDAAWEQAQRQAWRSLSLVIKAKFESIEAGIFTFEQEFMPHIVLPDGSTVWEVMVPQIEAAYRTGQMPALLPAALGGSNGQQG